MVVDFIWNPFAAAPAQLHALPAAVHCPAWLALPFYIFIFVSLTMF